MRDSDDLRRRIEARLLELGLDAVVVSQELGFNRGYLWDYFRKGTPKTMPTETKIKLAERLKLQPAEIGVVGVLIVPRGGGFSDDAEPYFSEGGDFPAHIGLFKVKSRALDKHPGNVVPGRLAAFNLNRIDPGKIAPGTVVVAQLYDREVLTKCHGTVLRQFLPPDKLVTNSSGGNDIMALDDPQRPYLAVIKGTLAYMVDALDSDGDRFAPVS